MEDFKPLNFRMGPNIAESAKCANALLGDYRSWFKMRRQLRRVLG